MKVAISVPDPVFDAAERLARRLQVSRSQLYAQALQEYLMQRQDTRVTERLDAVYAESSGALDSALDRAQRSALGHEAW